MADTINLREYKNNIETALNEQFSDFNITVFRDLEEDFDLPAIVINKPVFEPKDPAIQNLRCRATAQLNAFVVYSATDTNNDIECIVTSAELSKFLNNKTFGQKTPVTVTLIEPVLEDGLENYFIQRIDFQQIVEL